MGLQTQHAMASGLDSRPTVEDFRDDSPWVRLAKTHWLDAANVRKVKHDVIKKDIWDPLEAENFSFRSLLTLENLNILEKYCASRLCSIRLGITKLSTGFSGQPTPKTPRIIMSYY
jgi:hypothetical protein